MNASTAIKKFGLEQAFNYLYKDPKENLVKLMDGRISLQAASLKRSGSSSARRSRIRSTPTIPSFSGFSQTSTRRS